jgi:methionyl-tRNA synthetase
MKLVGIPVCIIVIVFEMVFGFRTLLNTRAASTTLRLRRAFSSSTALRSVPLGANTERKNFFITTPIYYVNGLPHLGHAYTSAMTDIIARYQRKDNNNVLFLTGTDEHGQKVEKSATSANTTPLEYSTLVSAKFREMTKLLGCSNDDFIRTTEDRHKRAVTELWKKLEANGQIYLGFYEGWYSVRDEAFYSELELVDGKAPTGAEVEWVKEASYFFRLSQWSEQLRQLHTENPDLIAPRKRRAEVFAQLDQEGGLKDLSISRTTFSWGIPVPNDPAHVMYVWLDALVNYITALGYPDTNSEKFKQFWPASVHIVGKDIIRFHSLFWPAFLMAVGLPTPKVHIKNNIAINNFAATTISNHILPFLP